MKKILLISNMYPSKKYKHYGVFVQNTAQILENNGLIISEYDIGTRPSKYTFPARNRIISALSDGVLVIEARKNSGSQITVDFALDQGKNVYAVPGDITRINTEGTNELIKQGAKIVTCIDDILEDY